MLYTRIAYYEIKDIYQTENDNSILLNFFFYGIEVKIDQKT